MRPTSGIITATLLLCLAIACKKGKNDNEDRHKDRGVIIGFDTQTCSCCGGLLINFKPSEPVSATNPPKLIKNNPAEFGIDTNTQFPIDVEVEWTSNVPPALMTCALGNLIMITTFKRI